MDAVPQKLVRITNSSRGPGECSIGLTGLTSQELERMEGMLYGQWWVKGNAGRLEFSPSREQPPSPTDDDMLPEWRKPREGDGTEQYQTELFGVDGKWGQLSPGIIIQHLCGYHYSKDGYASNGRFLERCGFVCMRSRRGEDGRFWEMWLLPGLWAAKGVLADKIRDLPKDEQMDFVLKFLPTQVSFGTLDVTVQRMAQVID